MINLNRNIIEVVFTAAKSREWRKERKRIAKKACGVLTKACGVLTLVTTVASCGGEDLKGNGDNGGKCKDGTTVSSLKDCSETTLPIMSADEIRKLNANQLKEQVIKNPNTFARSVFANKDALTQEQLDVLDSMSEEEKTAYSNALTSQINANNAREEAAAKQVPPVVAPKPVLIPETKKAEDSFKVAMANKDETALATGILKGGIDLEAINPTPAQLLDLAHISPRAVLEANTEVQTQANNVQTSRQRRTRAATPYASIIPLITVVDTVMQRVTSNPLNYAKEAALYQYQTNDSIDFALAYLNWINSNFPTEDVFSYQVTIKGSSSPDSIVNLMAHQNISNPLFNLDQTNFLNSFTAPRISLNQSIKLGMPRGVENACGEPGVDVNAIGDDGKYAIELIVELSRPELLSTLKGSCSGFNENLVLPTQNNNTAFGLALLQDKPAVYNKFLSMQTLHLTFTSKNNDGHNDLQIATIKGNATVVNILHNKQADFTVLDNDELDLVDLGIKHNLSLELIKTLVGYGVPLTRKTTKMFTAPGNIRVAKDTNKLSLAVIHKSSNETLEYLRNEGANDINGINEEGLASLNFAGATRDTRSINYLLDHSSNKTISGTYNGAANKNACSISEMTGGRIGNLSFRHSRSWTSHHFLHHHHHTETWYDCIP